MESPLPEIFNLKNDFGEKENLVKRKELGVYRRKMERINREFSYEENRLAKQKLDRRALERLKSLGYIHTSPGTTDKTYGPKHDVKVMISYHNKSVKATRLYNEGRTSEAIGLLKEVITERSDIGIAYKNLADIYDKEGRTNDAIVVLKAGLEAVPSYYEIFYSYVTLLLSTGRYDEVIEVTRENSLLQKDIDPEIWNFLGIAYWNSGDIENARSSYEKSIELDRKYPIPLNNLGTLHLYMYQQTKDRTEYDRALDCFNQAVKLDPFYSDAYHGMGVTYIGGKEYDAAVGCFKKALEYRPDYGMAMFYLGYAYLLSGDKVNACLYFNRLKTNESFQDLAPNLKKKLDEWLRVCPSDKRKLFPR
jgi:tetratricopeptide (TPR) repeat protein